MLIKYRFQQNAVAQQVQKPVNLEDIETQTEMKP